MISKKISQCDSTDSIETSAFVNKEHLYDSIESSNKEHMNRYEPVDLKQLKKQLKKLINIDRTVLNNSFIDFGCGKGRVLIMAEKMGFKNVIGVEFSKQLFDICKDNLRNIKSSIIQIFYIDAVDFELSGDIKTFYFFNPFDFYIFKKVLVNIRQFLKTKSYDGFIVYVYPNKFGRLDPSEYELLFQNKGPINPYHIYKVKF